VLEPCYPIHVFAGIRTLEVLPTAASKANVISKVLDKLKDMPPCFIFAVGVDRADESMFQYFLENPQPAETEVITCTVGSKSSRAQYFAIGAREIEYLLATMTKLEYQTLRAMGGRGLARISSGVRSTSAERWSGGRGPGLRSDMLKKKNQTTHKQDYWAGMKDDEFSHMQVSPHGTPTLTGLTPPSGRIQHLTLA